MKDNQFFAMMSRMKYITRWGLMRNTIKENISEHSLEVAMIAHALGVINNEVYGGDINPERLAVLGLYHDVTEIITGDMPTPVKYYNTDIKSVYKDIEKRAGQELLTGLPSDLRSPYESVLIATKEEELLWKYIKAADKISAYIKCIEELNMGNGDFTKAHDTIKNSIDKMELREVSYFMEHFIDAYNQTIDDSGE